MAKNKKEETQEEVEQTVDTVENEGTEKDSSNENQETASEPKKEEENWQEKYIRLYSEFDNYRKRTIKERSDLIKTANEDIFKELLPVLDDFDRALKSISEASDIEGVKEGVNLIHNKMLNSMKQKGLEEMDSAGKQFDSDLYEAVTEFPAPDESMKGKVVDVLEKGYSLNGKIIRFAKVVVGK